MIKINGKEYGGVINVLSITESFEKVYGESSVVKQNGEDWYDVMIVPIKKQSLKKC